MEREGRMEREKYLGHFGIFNQNGSLGSDCASAFLGSKDV
jgi:hypothetical protein